MKRVLLIAAVALCFGLAGLDAVAQIQTPPPPPAPEAAQPTAAAPAETPSIFPKPESVLRPVPSILPTLRLIDSQMAANLGFTLDLTDAQKTKVLDLLTKSDNYQKPKIETQIKAMQDYVSLLGKSDAAQADLLAASDRVLKADSEIMAVRVAALVALRAILTPEQNKKLSESLSLPAQRWLPRKNPPAEARQP